MSQPDVFLCARSADYPAAWECYKNLTDGGLHCFFGDEALLKLGDTAYRKRVLHARVGAAWLVLFLSRPEDATSPYLEETWRDFQTRPDRRLLLVPPDFPEDQLPDTFQNSVIFRQGGDRQELVKILIGKTALPEAPPVEEDAHEKIARRRWQPLAVAAGLAVLLGTTGVFLSDRSAAGGHTGNQLVTTQIPPLSPEEMISLWKADPLTGIHQIRISSVVQAFSWIPPGSFNMGSPVTEPGRQPDEVQRLEEIRQGFWMARTECTQDLWEAVMGVNPSRFPQPTAPVDSVSWEDIAGSGNSFLARLNARALLPERLAFALPDEIQWEYACRAGSTGPFSFNPIDGRFPANFDSTQPPWGDSSFGFYINQTLPVAAFPPNAWNLYDMHGNVREWCSTPEGVVKKSVPARETQRVVRGGSWQFFATRGRSASRAHFRGDVGDDNTGFRLAVVAKR
jgi:formylglycine-generating enzyme